MEGSTFWKGEKSCEVAVNTSTGARFKSQCAIGGLWIGSLELEKLFNEGRAGRENPKYSVGEASCSKGRSGAVKVRKSFLFQSKSGEREGKEGAGGGEKGRRLDSEVRGAEERRDDGGRSQSEQVGKLREWGSSSRGRSQ